MKKIITAAVLLLATALSAFSQTKNITVSGRVLEDTNEPAVQATIQLLSLPDSAYAAGVATTGNGYFTLPKVNAGKYVLYGLLLLLGLKYLSAKNGQSACWIDIRK